MFCDKTFTSFQKIIIILFFYIQQGCIKLIKSKLNNKDIYNVTKDFKSVLFFWTLYSSNIPGKKMLHGLNKNMKQLWKQTIFSIDNNQKCFLSSKSE